MTNIISFRYRNHRGELATRIVDVDSIEFIREPGFGYQSGWFVSGIDQAKNFRRSFALSHIVMDNEFVPKFYKLMEFKKNEQKEHN